FLRNFVKPLAATAAALVLMPLLGLRNPGAVLGYGACVFVLATLTLEFYRGSLARRRVTGRSLPAALADLFVHHNRRYGGYVVHLGIIVAVVAIVGSQFYQLQR